VSKRSEIINLQDETSKIKQSLKWLPQGSAVDQQSVMTNLESKQQQLKDLMERWQRESQEPSRTITSGDFGIFGSDISSYPGKRRSSQQHTSDYVYDNNQLSTNLKPRDKNSAEIIEVASKVGNLIDIVTKVGSNKQDALKLDVILEANIAKVKQENNGLSEPKARVKALDEAQDLLGKKEFIDGAIQAYHARGMDFADLEIRPEFRDLNKPDIHHKDENELTALKALAADVKYYFDIDLDKKMSYDDKIQAKKQFIEHAFNNELDNAKAEDDFKGGHLATYESDVKAIDSARYFLINNLHDNRSQISQEIISYAQKVEERLAREGQQAIIKPKDVEVQRDYLSDDIRERVSEEVARQRLEGIRDESDVDIALKALGIDHDEEYRDGDESEKTNKIKKAYIDKIRKSTSGEEKAILGAVRDFMTGKREDLDSSVKVYVRNQTPSASISVTSTSNVVESSCQIG